MTDDEHRTEMLGNQDGTRDPSRAVLVAQRCPDAPPITFSTVTDVAGRELSRVFYVDDQELPLDEFSEVATCVGAAMLAYARGATS